MHIVGHMFTVSGKFHKQGFIYISIEDNGVLWLVAVNEIQEYECEGAIFSASFRISSNDDTNP